VSIPPTSLSHPPPEREPEARSVEGDTGARPPLPFPSRWRALATAARDWPPATRVFVGLTGLALLLALLLILSPAGPAPIPPAPVLLDIEPEIRVRVLRRTTEASLAGEQSLVLVDRHGEAHAMASPVALTIEAGEFALTTPDRVVLRIPLTEPLEFRSARYTLNPGAPGSITLDAPLRVYPAINAPDRFDVVAELPMERYLPGVLAGEMYSHWPPGAFEAQAVAARSYAMHDRQLAQISGRNWDVERGTRSQSFVGETSLSVAVDAVARTRGQVLTWEGGLLRAYYSSSIGGRAASAADVFRSDAGYEYNRAAPIQATRREYFDQESPTHRWRRARDVIDLSDRIRAWGKDRDHPVKDLTRLLHLRESAHNAVGRPSEYTLEDTRRNTATITAEQLRVACNYTGDEFEELAFEDRVLSNDLEFAVRGDEVTIDGRGYGHGVGMCQHSAAALAERGEPYIRILQRYYPGARIVRWYE